MLSEDEELFLGQLPDIFVPGAINKHLKPCQQNIIRFLYTHYAEKDGGILCDNKEIHEVLPMVVFISALVNRKTDTIEKFLLIINEEEKSRLNLWLFLMKHVGINCKLIKYCGKNTSSYLSIEGYEHSIYILKAKRLVNHITFLKKTKWAILVYDDFIEKSSLTSILNYAKDLTCNCKFIISHSSIFQSKKYFWSLFKFIDQSSKLGKSWQEFDDKGYQYYFNKMDCASGGKMSKMDIYKTLDATRIRLEFVSREVTCTEDLHKDEPWNVQSTSTSGDSTETTNIK